MILLGVVTMAAVGALSAAPVTREHPPLPHGASERPRDVFEEYLATPFPPADGFEHPVAAPDGGGHPRNATAIAHGRVVEVVATDAGGGAEVTIEHVFYENASKRTVRSRSFHLARTDVKAGELVTRGQVIGELEPHGEDPAGCATHVELHAAGPEAGGEPLDAEAFIRARASLPIPAREPSLLLGHHGTHRLRRYEHGQPRGDYEIAFGQAAGAKERRGDLRTPVGMYFVVAKSQGPFSGDYADYYGGHWIKVNYPNAFDAERGLDAGLITSGQRDVIAAAWATRSLTPQHTKLGGGIGLHGWIEEWDPAGGAYLSWGCVVLQTDAIEQLYPEVPVGTMVVLLQ